MDTPLRPAPPEHGLMSGTEAQVLAICKAFLGSPGLTRAQIMAKMGVGGQHEEAMVRQFQRRLSLAMEWGWLRREGGDRYARYYPTAPFQHAMAMRHIGAPREQRPKVGYDFELLRSYEPNKTFYLDARSREHLHKYGKINGFDRSDPTQAQTLRRFMMDLSHHSALLEGVRAQYVDTIQLLEDNIRSQNLSETDAVILRNLYNAARFLVDLTAPNDQGHRAWSRVSANSLCQIHALVSDGLLHDRRQQGRLRHHKVEIAYSQYVPLFVPDQIESAFHLMVQKAAEIQDPFEQACFLTVHIPYLQPFSDCNKRVSRVACNIPLLSQGVLPVSWRDVTPRDYHDALLCVYECRSTYGMAQIFTQAYIHSAQRFEEEQRQRQPSRLEVVYAREIAQTIRRRVLDMDENYKPQVPPEHWPYLQGYIESVLRDALENEMVLVPYQISYGAWLDWRQACLHRDAATDESQDAAQTEALPANDR